MNRASEAVAGRVATEVDVRRPGDAPHGAPGPEPRFAARTAIVAAAALAHVDEVDRDGRAPAEAIAELKAQRLLGVMFPPRDGGEGATPEEVGGICFDLAKACASSAMIFAMHQIQVACVLRHAGPSAWHQAFRQRIAQHQVLLAGSTTDGVSGGATRESGGCFEVDREALRVDKTGAVISYGDVADALLVTARRAPDAPPSSQAAAVFLAEDCRLQPCQAWDTLGMRGTCSVAYELQARGHVDQLLGAPFSTVHAQTMLPMAHLAWSSVWAGIAADAAERARRHARRSLRPGLPTSPAVRHAADAAATYQALRATLRSAFQTYAGAQDDPGAAGGGDTLLQMNLLKISVSEQALAVVLAALRATGLNGYRNDTDVSVARHLRDICSAQLMIGNDRIRDGIAQPLLFSETPALWS